MNSSAGWDDTPTVSLWSNRCLGRGAVACPCGMGEEKAAVGEFA